MLLGLQIMKFYTISKKILNKLFVLLFLLSLLGCASNEEVLTESAVEEITQTEILSETPIANDNPKIDQGSNSSDLCAYVWTSRTLPELSAQIQDDFIIEGFDKLKVNAEAYGENCIDPATNKVKYFTAMQTDFHITYAVNDLSDEVLGNLLNEIINLLSEYPEESLPGPMPGHIGIRFGKGNEDRYFWFEIGEGLEAIDKGYKGRTLVKLLE